MNRNSRQTSHFALYTSLIIFFFSSIICLGPTTASSAEQSIANQYWQLTFSYDASQLRILEAAPVAKSRKRLSTPGLAGAPLKISYSAEWLNSQGATLYSAQLTVPIGERAINAQDAACEILIPEEGLFVVRIPGPAPASSPASMRLVKNSSLNSAQDTRPLPPMFTPSQQLIPIERIVDQQANPANQLGLPEGALGATKIRDVGDDDNRLVIAVAGDGYTAANLANGDFEADAAALVAAFMTKSPWDELFAGANVYRIDIESNEQGSDQAGNVGGSAPGTFVDTYLHSTYWTSSIERLLTIPNLGRSRVISAANSYIGFGVWDHLFVLVNHTKYGGSGGSVSVSSVHSSSSEIIMHEFGHTFAGLADEYETAYPGFPIGDGEANVDFDFSGPDLKWNYWVDAGTPLPTPETSPWTNNVVGAFEGARYRSTGIYRPWHNCLMRSLSRPFCPICVEENIIRFWNNVNLVDDVYPPTGSGEVHEVAATPLQIGVNSLPFPSMNYSWSLNGLPLPDTGPEVSISAEQVGDGDATLDLTLSYDTDLVRKTTFSAQYSWDLHSTFCCQIAGDANGSGSITIADVTFLLARIFSGGVAPACCGEGDANGDGVITIGDVTYLINRIFGGGPAPVCGPAGMGC